MPVTEAEIIEALRPVEDPVDRPDQPALPGLEAGAGRGRAFTRGRRESGNQRL